MSTSISDLQQLYIANFGRPADPVGLAYWSGLLDSDKTTLAEISGKFSEAAEFKTNYSGRTSAAIVNSTYVNLFSHDADVAGLLYWTGLIDSGVATPSQVIAGISLSALGSDLVTIAAKSVYAMAFTNYVGASAERIAESSGRYGYLVAITALRSVADQASLDAGLAMLAHADANAPVIGNPVYHWNGKIEVSTMQVDVPLVGVPDSIHGVIHA